jgi:hypothetical protein
LLRFAHKTSKNRLTGDFLPYKLRKEPDNRNFCGISDAKIHKRNRLLGVPVRAMFRDDGMIRKEYRRLEFPLLDLLGNMFHKPVYEIVKKNDVPVPYSVPVYDTTIYFDELSIADDKEAVNFILSEVSQGLERGHRNFKIKTDQPIAFMKDRWRSRRKMVLA